MGYIEYAQYLEQLNKFANKDGILEIAMRGNNKRFKAFQKVIIGNVADGKQQQGLNQIFNAINNNNQINMKNFDILSNINNFSKINMVINGLNLCATCAGFAIMYMKLDKMSSKINEVLSTVKRGHDINAHYEFKKVLSSHSDMLDCRKKQNYYTEEQMRELVDSEYNVLNMLLEVLLKDTAEDIETLLFSILSLSSMLSVSLVYFDEIYYFNNKDHINGDDVWHTSHDNWIKIYDLLSSNEFIEKVQDYGMFTLGLTTQECDAYYLSVLDNIKDSKQNIEENQKLIVSLDNQEMLESYRYYNNQQLKETIEKAFDETELLDNNPDMKSAYNKTMKEVGLV